MTIRTIAELRTLMPVNTAQGISAQDINDFVDTVEEFTTQRVSAKTASYTAVVGDNRTFFTVNNSGITTFTVPSAAPAGWECAVMQIGLGQVTVAPGGTGVRRHPDAHTKTAKQYAVVYIKVFSNTGTAPNFAFTGDTGE